MTTGAVRKPAVGSRGEGGASPRSVLRGLTDAMLGGMPDYPRHPGVDAYFAGLPDWQAGLCQDLRDLIHDAVPGITETIKRTVQPYFVHHGNVCAFLATKDHINLFLYDGAIVPDPDGIITAGHTNSTARTVAFRENDKIPRQALGTMLGRIAANNEAGGWRKIKKDQGRER